LIYGGIHPEVLVRVYREMGLPEPFVFPHFEDGVVAGLITGFLRTADGHKYLDVDHMIVRRGTRRKFHTMMAMSEAATQAAFDDGCAYILISIFKNDERISGLRAWAKRMQYQSWADSEDSEWFIRYNERYDNGQRRESPLSEATPGSSRPERG
jgi:hypothetical protein